MALTTTKLFVLGFLCATAIVLGSGIVTLTVLLQKRRGIIDKRGTAAGAKTSPNAAVRPNPNDDPIAAATAKSKTVRPLVFPPNPRDYHTTSTTTYSHAAAGPGPGPGPGPAGGRRGGPRGQGGDAIIEEAPVAPVELAEGGYPLSTHHAPHSTSPATSSDAHFAAALRLIPFENDGGMAGNALPAPLIWGGEGERQRRRGMDFVKQVKTKKQGGELKWGQGGRWLGGGGGGFGDRGGGGSAGGATQEGPVYLPQLILRLFGFRSVTDLLSTAADAVRRLGGPDFTSRLPASSGVSTEAAGAGAGAPPAGTDDEAPASAARRAARGREEGQTLVGLHHLASASELGNPHAQNLIANTLASGVLPTTNDLTALTGNSANVPEQVGNLTVPSDYATGGTQLARAIVLWHAAAMGGSIEASMALGFRARYSASGGKPLEMNKFITEADLLGAAEVQAAEAREGAAATMPTADPNAKPNSKDPAVPPHLHPSTPSSHYGLLGTCQSALEYYANAAHLSMDAIESSDFRGKVNPSMDRHRLAEIHSHGGASSALSGYNKPDELEEAVQYYRMRAKATPPDINAAYTLANLYHYGLRGVSQSMSLALKYYTIAADAGSWEAAGQAGKFHLWGMGLDDTERDLGASYRYFKMGAPGGVEGCERRWKAKRDRNKNRAQKKKERKEGRKGGQKGKKGEEGDGTDDDKDGSDSAGSDAEWDDLHDDEWDGEQCDHPSVNGMGLLYLYGVPMVLPPNTNVARRYFALARDMGNMDSGYNLAMMTLGWMEKTDPLKPHQRRTVEVDGPTQPQLPRKALAKDDYTFAVREFHKSAQRGHMQSKHRLAMLLSSGIKIPDPKRPGQTMVAVAQNCPTALNYFRDVAENGLTLSRRTRAAYKQYVAGEYTSSLRNYLAAAEVGSVVGMVNAAFLLERGHCLGLSRGKCTRASVRLWRAAARQGDVEACLRVGDFYYYGRLREEVEEDEDEATSLEEEDGDGESTPSGRRGSRRSAATSLPGVENKVGYAMGPYPWIRYVLYPEDLIPVARRYAIRSVRWALSKVTGRKGGASTAGDGGGEERTCPAVELGEDGTCEEQQQHKDNAAGSSSNPDDDHLAIAAQYYRRAVDEHDSPRANFNLGFMHEWGLGLKQDFPLAKRHYDLAAASKSGEAELAVQFALLAMGVHEKVVRASLAWEEWRSERRRKDSDTATAVDEPLPPSNAPRVDDSQGGGRGHPVPPGPRGANDGGGGSKVDVVLAHILTWESGLIMLLTAVLSRLIRHRLDQQQR